MKKKKTLSALCAIFAAVLLSLTSTVPVLAYEDEYAKDGNIQWIWNPDYANGIYTLDDGINGTTSTLTLFLVTENVHYINQMNIVYDFVGKMNREDAPSYEFFINVGMPANHTTLSTVQLGDMSANLKQVQVGIYPGYYNFYNYGKNYVSYAGSSNWYVITLSPNYKLNEDDEYKYYDTVPEDSFVEVQKGEDKRLYVLVGELEFLLLVEEDFENWAIETEAHYVEESMANGDHEEIEVEVPEENLENLLGDEKPEAEVETTVDESTEVKEPEAPVFEEVQDASTASEFAGEEAGDGSASWGIVVIVVSAVAGVVILLLIIKMLSYRKAGRS